MSMGEIKRRVNVLAGEHRCASTNGKMECGHEKCAYVYEYEQKILRLLENAERCDKCGGTGKLPVQP